MWEGRSSSDPRLLDSEFISPGETKRFSGETKLPDRDATREAATQRRRAGGSSPSTRDGSSHDT
jgi:hypothetical protein